MSRGKCYQLSGLNNLTMISVETVNLKYLLLPPYMEINHTMYHKGTKLASKLVLFNTFNLNNEYG